MVIGPWRYIVDCELPFDIPHQRLYSYTLTLCSHCRNTWDNYQLYHESLVTDRMKYVNPPPSPIISLIWGTVNILK